MICVSAGQNFGGSVRSLVHFLSNEDYPMMTARSLLAKSDPCMGSANPHRSPVGMWGSLCAGWGVTGPYIEAFCWVLLEALCQVLLRNPC